MCRISFTYSKGGPPAGSISNQYQSNGGRRVIEQPPRTNKPREAKNRFETSPVIVDWDLVTYGSNELPKPLAKTGSTSFTINSHQSLPAGPRNSNESATWSMTKDYISKSFGGTTAVSETSPYPRQSTPHKSATSTAFQQGLVADSPKNQQPARRDLNSRRRGGERTTIASGPHGYYGQKNRKPWI